MPKMRLDTLLFERGLAESRSQAQRLIMAGQVRVNNQLVDRPASAVSSEAQIDVETGARFVSRGGEKLRVALEAFTIDVIDKVCADIGASTGGFTDCLLQAGAAKVFAIDVGRGILHWRLRQDPRVIVMEDTNARYLERLPEEPQLVTIDASFISLKLLLPVVRGWFRGDGGQVVALIKPQFEAGRSQAGRGQGVIRDLQVHRQVLQEVLGCAVALGFGLAGLIRSPLQGPKGNVEFLTYLNYPGYADKDLNELIQAVLQSET